MNPLKIQTNAEGSFVTYKLEGQESLDQMTMGMLRNNRIKGLLPLDYSQIDSERWIKYDITSMMSLRKYISGMMTRKKALDLLSQVTDLFLLVEDYMIDASFIILDANYVFANAATGELGIICLPLSGFVGKVTIKEFVGSIMRSGQFNSRENCDYVTKLLNFANGSGFSITGLKQLLDELIHESVQRTEHRNPNEMISGGMSAFEDVSGQMAVTVESVANMVSHMPKDNFSNGIPPADRVTASGYETKPLKEKKGFFKKKKKKEIQSNTVVPSPVGGMSVPGMEIPGMAVPGQKEVVRMPDQGMTLAKQMPNQPLSSEKAPLIQKSVSVDKSKSEIPISSEQDLSGIASQINGKRPMTTISSKPEWSISPDFETKVGISDGTIMLNVEMDPPAVLRRLRNRETTVIENGELVIGKDRNSVDYCISDNSTISRVHAKIIRREKQYFIKDNNSMNHTYVNDRQVLGGQEVMIENGDRIRLSDEEFIFSL